MAEWWRWLFKQYILAHPGYCHSAGRAACGPRVYHCAGAYARRLCSISTGICMRYLRRRVLQGADLKFCVRCRVWNPEVCILSVADSWGACIKNLFSVTIVLNRLHVQELGTSQEAGSAFSTAGSPYSSQVDSPGQQLLAAPASQYFAPTKELSITGVGPCCHRVMP